MTVKHNLELLTADDLAKKLNISKSHLWRLRDRGLLPDPIRLGVRSIRWSLKSIEKWLENGGIDCRWYQNVR